MRTLGSSWPRPLPIEAIEINRNHHLGSEMHKSEARTKPFRFTSNVSNLSGSTKPPQRSWTSSGALSALHCWLYQFAGAPAASHSQ